MIKNNNFIINIETKTKKWLDFKPVKYKNLASFFEYRINLLSLHTDLKKFLKNQNNQAEISIFLVSNQQIKKINQEFRNINKPTNVLTFGYLDEKLIRNSNLNAILKNNNYHFLGDIFFHSRK
jgi:ssRNA-specific RNase YbeY (16S rRNA maturation enzyme)